MSLHLDNFLTSIKVSLMERIFLIKLVEHNIPRLQFFLFSLIGYFIYISLIAVLLLSYIDKLKTSLDLFLFLKCRCRESRQTKHDYNLTLFFMVCGYEKHRRK